PCDSDIGWGRVGDRGTYLGERKRTFIAIGIVSCGRKMIRASLQKPGDCGAAIVPHVEFHAITPISRSDIEKVADHGWVYARIPGEDHGSPEGPLRKD